MPVMSCSSKNTKAHFEKHVIITTIISPWVESNTGAGDWQFSALQTELVYGT